jgi:hypothetical protein
MWRILKSIIEFLLSIFRPADPSGEPEEIKALPHPEEPQDEGITLDNVDARAARQAWYEQWQVPDGHRLFWDCIRIIPAYKYADPANNEYWNSEIYVKPEWCNAGIIAHEQAHTAWFNLLTAEERAAFESEYYRQLISDRWMIYLNQVNWYMNTSTVEAHAEVYRYLGEKMPESLKQYYPKLY